MPNSPNATLHEICRERARSIWDPAGHWLPPKFSSGFPGESGSIS
jgi:hypothetical protein